MQEFVLGVPCDVQNPNFYTTYVYYIYYSNKCYINTINKTGMTISNTVDSQ